MSSNFFQDLMERHERLKKRIHSFRIPLSPTGQRIMGFVYFCIPVISGYYLMQAVIARSQKNLVESNITIENKRFMDENVRKQNQALQAVLDNARQNNSSNQ